jgi:hypothetical protein
VIKQVWFAAALLLMSCGGSSSSAPTQPSTSAAGAVTGFMKAVHDNDLAKMSTLWGSASGPASKTKQPPDWQRRIAIMQAYLKNDSFRLTSDVPGSDQDHRDLQVEIKRQTCTWSVPFVAVKSSQGWVVNQVDISAAGNPARGCAEGAPPDSAKRG